MRLLAPEHGLRVNKNLHEDIEQLLKECEAHIQKSTGFSVGLARKEHQHVSFYFQSLATSTEEAASVPEILLQQGNCIPCALWHLLDEKDCFEKTFSQTSAENNYFLEQRHRTYQQCSDMLQVVLQPHYGLPETLEGKFLLHSERNGTGHCVAVQVSEKNRMCVCLGRIQQIQSHQATFPGCSQQRNRPPHCCLLLFAGRSPITGGRCASQPAGRLCRFYCRQ